MTEPETEAHALTWAQFPEHTAAQTSPGSQTCMSSQSCEAVTYHIIKHHFKTPTAVYTRDEVEIFRKIVFMGFFYVTDNNHLFERLFSEEFRSLGKFMEPRTR